MTEHVTTIVVPTVGRPSLRTLLQALAAGTSRPGPIVVVDDRRRPEDELGAAFADLGLDVRLLRSGGHGPAYARNLGWRHARTPWVSFLDDDVLPSPEWYAALLTDVRELPPDAAGSQGRVEVPLPTDRRPTDWERSTAGLEDALWITADLTYRRSALAAVGGFDERFPRAFREDADLGLRISASQGRIVRGRRRVTHPVRPSDDWASLRQQAGNADDALMRRLHGPRWRTAAAAPAGRRPRHVATAAAGLAAAVAAAAGARRLAAAAGGLWLAGTGEFAWARITPGPRDRDEVRRMILTSLAIPFAATWHSIRGVVQHRRAEPWHGVPEAVLFDRDGTLVHDVPYNGDPDRVEPVPGARGALDRLRRAGVRLGVVTNQSGVATGRITTEELAAVNARVEDVLGPFDTWQTCTHGREDACGCRKPAPGLVLAACEQLEADPARCVVIGDIGSDVEAARAAGATGILVPTAATRPQEVRAAEHAEPDLVAAVDAVLGGRW